jgi:trimethylamine---corrinoid protein Co-methyltransferase
MITRALEQDQVLTLHQAALDILERTGVMIPHPEILGRFADAGAQVDHGTNIVRIPPELVMRSVETSGKTFTLYGRDIERQAVFGTGRRNYNSIAGEASWVDEVGGARRYATLEDVRTATRFADALPWITMPGAMSDPHEIPSGYRCVAVMAEMLHHTTKPIHFWMHDRATARAIVEMMIALRGDEQAATQYPALYPFLEPISPLRFPFDGIDLLFETARLNLPVPIGPMAQMGLSAPATVAGTLAQEHAEILAGISITQLIHPGMPVCYGGICHAFDMATTQLIFSGPEQVIFGVAMTQLGKHLGLPVYINVGLTDSKRPDAQAGLEIAASLLAGAAAGADIFGHMGISGVDQATSLDMLVLQHEAISYVESALRRIDVSPDTLGLDVIDSVGPGGTFIDSMHTFEHFRKELWFPELLDRQYYQAWADGGATGMEERCRAYKTRILETHEVEPLPSEIDRDIEGIVDAARRSCS